MTKNFCIGAGTFSHCTFFADVSQFEASFPSASKDATHKSSNQNGYTEEERPQSPQQQPQDDQV